MTPFPGTLSKKPVPAGIKHSTQVMKYFLTPEQEEWLRRWFPEIENSRLMKASGIKFNTLHRFARELGLTKSEKGFKAIKRRQAKRIIRTCQKNGFYESIKGRKMSEACKEPPGCGRRYARANARTLSKWSGRRTHASTRG